MQNISGLDATICLGYLALVVGLGLYFSNKQKDNDDFFLGGRKMHWPVSYTHLTLPTSDLV